MKKTGLLIIALVFMLIFSGCSSTPFDSEGMLRPPKTSGDGQEICEALEKHLGRGPLFRYPRSGEYRSAITMEDLDGDGTAEAIVFYLLSTESNAASIAVLGYSHGEWKVKATAEGLSSNVNVLLFGDLIPERESREIIVGWKVGSNSGLLTVYSYLNGGLENIIIEDSASSEAQSASGYTGVAVCDMDSDSADEIMTATLNTVAGTSTVRMLKYLSGEGAERLLAAGVVNLDGSVSRYSKVTVGMLDDTTQGFIIDSYKGTETMQTEAVCWDKINAGLTAPFNNAKTGDVSGTDRIALTDSFDLDTDGLTEIPRHTLLPCYSEDSAEKFYKSSWYAYDSQTGTLSEKSEIDSIFNIPDGYYITLPTSWPTDITVRYDPNYSAFTFCTVNTNYDQITVSASELTGTETVLEKDDENDSAVIAQETKSFGTELFRLRVFERENEALVENYGYRKLREQNDKIWAVQIYSFGEQNGITYNAINACFYLM